MTHCARASRGGAGRLRRDVDGGRGGRGDRAGWNQVAPATSSSCCRCPTAAPASSTCWPRGWTGGRVPVPTTDPLGRPAVGAVLLVGRHRVRRDRPGRAACTCSPRAERDPKVTTTYGLGALLAAAVECGARHGGRRAGRLGHQRRRRGHARRARRRPRWTRPAPPCRTAGSRWPRWPGSTARPSCAAVDGRGHRRGQPADRAARRDRGLRPAEGRQPEDVPARRRAGALGRGGRAGLPGAPAGLADLPGRRAPPAGSARRCSRSAAAGSPASAWSAPRSDLRRALDAADLVITGEGSFDAQSLRGKVAAGVAAARREHGRALPGAGRAGPLGRRRRPPPGSRRRTRWSSSRRRRGGDGPPGRRAASSPPALAGSGAADGCRPARHHRIGSSAGGLRTYDGE